MSYSCYLGGVRMPTPAKLTVKIKGTNKTLVLLNEGEVNFLREAGLTELQVPFVFPMLTGGQSPDYYLGLLEKLKTGKKSTRFILTRVSPDGRRLFDTNLAVSLEDYTITEDAKNGLDVAVEASLKQWRSYGTKTVAVKKPAQGGKLRLAKAEKERDAGTAPAAKTYTVQPWDCLWAIAAKFYGKGSDYTRIAQANASQITRPNLIHPGQVLTLP